MISKKNLLALIEAIRISNSKARRLVEQAAHNADPGVNADLQHSLQLALDQLDKSAKHMQKVHDDLGTVAFAVLQQIPEPAEEPVAAELEYHGRSSSGK